MGMDTEKQREKNQMMLHRLWYIADNNVMSVVRQPTHIRNTFHVAVGSGVFCDKCFGFDIDLDDEHTLIRCVLPSRPKFTDIENYGFEDNGDGKIECTACWKSTDSKNTHEILKMQSHYRTKHSFVLQLLQGVADLKLAKVDE